MAYCYLFTRAYVTYFFIFLIISILTIPEIFLLLIAVIMSFNYSYSFSFLTSVTFLLPHLSPHFFKIINLPPS